MDGPVLNRGEGRFDSARSFLERDEGLELAVGRHDDAALAGDGRGALIHLPSGMARPQPLPAFMRDEETSSFLPFSKDTVGRDWLGGHIVDALGGLRFRCIFTRRQNNRAVLVRAFHGGGNEDAWCAGRASLQLLGGT